MRGVYSFLAKVFIVDLTSGASPFFWDFLYERFLLTCACNAFMAYWKVGKYLHFGYRLVVGLV